MGYPHLWKPPYESMVVYGAWAVSHRRTEFWWDHQGDSLVRTDLQSVGQGHETYDHRTSEELRLTSCETILPRFTWTPGPKTVQVFASTNWCRLLIYYQYDYRKCWLSMMNWFALIDHLVFNITNWFYYILLPLGIHCFDQSVTNSWWPMNELQDGMIGTEWSTRNSQFIKLPLLMLRHDQRLFRYIMIGIIPLDIPRLMSTPD